MSVVSRYKDLFLGQEPSLVSLGLQYSPSGGLGVSSVQQGPARPAEPRELFAGVPESRPLDASDYICSMAVPGRHVHILTPRTCEHDLIWKKDL